MGELQNGAAPAATESTPAPVETPAAEKATLEDTLSAVWERHNPPRQADGKFQGKQPAEAAPEAAAPEGQESPDQPAQEVVETASPSIDAPLAWSAEEKALWAKVPPEAQAIVSRREAEAHKAITQMGERIKAHEPVAAFSNSRPATSRASDAHPKTRLSSSSRRPATWIKTRLAPSGRWRGCPAIR
jgi:hypothetical protein